MIDLGRLDWWFRALAQDARADEKRLQAAGFFDAASRWGAEALAYDHAADALALVQSAQGAEALTVFCAMGRYEFMPEDWPLLSDAFSMVEKGARRQLAARLVATALKLRGDDER